MVFLWFLTSQDIHGFLTSLAGPVSPSLRPRHSMEPFLVMKDGSRDSGSKRLAALTVEKRNGVPNYWDGEPESHFWDGDNAYHGYHNDYHLVIMVNNGS